MEARGAPAGFDHGELRDFGSADWTSGTAGCSTKDAGTPVWSFQEAVCREAGTPGSCTTWILVDAATGEMIDMHRVPMSSPAPSSPNAPQAAVRVHAHAGVRVHAHAGVRVHAHAGVRVHAHADERAVTQSEQCAS